MKSRHIRRRSVLVGVAILAGASVSLSEVRAQSRDSLSERTREFVSVDAPIVALTDVIVIDGTGSGPRAGQTVVIRDDRIVAVGPSAPAGGPLPGATPGADVGAAVVVWTAVTLRTVDWSTPRSWRLAVACAAAWASHVLLDWLGTDAMAPIGVMALWPVDSALSVVAALVPADSPGIRGADDLAPRHPRGHAGTAPAGSAGVGRDLSPAARGAGPPPPLTRSARRLPHSRICDSRRFTTLRRSLP